MVLEHHEIFLNDKTNMLYCQPFPHTSKYSHACFYFAWSQYLSVCDIILFLFTNHIGGFIRSDLKNNMNTYKKLKSEIFKKFSYLFQ
jgi:hypothetical protein